MINIYRYETTLKNSDSIGTKAIFTNQKIQRKLYYKSHIKEIYNEKGFSEVIVSGELPEDTSDIFFILKRKQQERFISTVLERVLIRIDYYLQR